MFADLILSDIERHVLKGVRYVSCPRLRRSFRSALARGVVERTGAATTGATTG